MHKFLRNLGHGRLTLLLNAFKLLAYLIHTDEFINSAVLHFFKSLNLSLVALLQLGHLGAKLVLTFL